MILRCGECKTGQRAIVKRLHGPLYVGDVWGEIMLLKGGGARLTNVGDGMKIEPMLPRTEDDDDYREADPTARRYVCTCGAKPILTAKTLRRLDAYGKRSGKPYVLTTAARFMFDPT